MNKLIIAAVIAGLSGTAYAQGGSNFGDIPRKDRLDVADTETNTGTIIVGLNNEGPRRDWLDVSEDSLGSQPQIGGVSGSSIWDYVPRKDRLDVD